MLPIETFDSRGLGGRATLAAELGGLGAAEVSERLDPPQDLRYGRRFLTRIFTS
jgi:hypothetical protein